MEVWLNVLAFVLFLGFFTAFVMAVKAVGRKNDIRIKSRLKKSSGVSEVIYANLGLIGMCVLVVFKLYAFVPAVLMFVLFIICSTRIESGIADYGALVGTAVIEWEFMKGYKFTEEGADSNIIILKIRANRKQYVLICNREDKDSIIDVFKKQHIRETEVMKE